LEVFHLLSDLELDSLQRGSVDELSERIELLLIEKSQEVVAETAHLRVAIQKQFLHHSGNLVHETESHHVRPSLQSLLVRLTLREGPLPHMLLVEQHDKAGVLLAILWFFLRAAREHRWHLVDLHQSVAEEEFSPIIGPLDLQVAPLDYVFVVFPPG
jgi:hypothetical protein